MVIEATDETFNSAIGRNGRVLLMFKASWCGPCKALLPQVKKIAEEHPDVRVVVIDEKGSEKAMNAYKVKAFPTLIMFDVTQGKIGPATEVERSPSAIRKALKG